MWTVLVVGYEKPFSHVTFMYSMQVTSEDLCLKAKEAILLSTEFVRVSYFKHRD